MTGSAAQSRPVSPTRALQRRIAETGPITIAAFMETCLGDPTFGYYLGRDPLGADGDFVTAPEISQIFGELIGLWCVEVWRAMDRPAGVRLIELGPGRGTLMADALRAARVDPAFLEAADIRLVETSPVLRARQAETLAGVPLRPSWHGDLAQVPPGPAILVANEFVDALPVRQFVRRDGSWHERCVGLDEHGALAFCTAAEPSREIDLIPEALQRQAPDGAVVEVRPAAARLVAEIGARAAHGPQTALMIDYGHGESGVGETLQAVRRHRFADPLRDIGAADVTAHVDFAALGTAAARAGLTAWGPSTQAAFLLALGLAQRCERLMRSAEPAKAREIADGAARLVDPARMGELFKVAAFTSPGLPAPPPFGPAPSGDDSIAEPQPSADT